MCEVCGQAQATVMVAWTTLTDSVVEYPTCQGCMPEGDDEDVSIRLIEQRFVPGSGWLVAR